MNQLKTFMNKDKKPAAGGAPGGQKDDYGDKGTPRHVVECCTIYSLTNDIALTMAQKKMGMQSNKQTNEKITDGARGLFEKVTG